MHGFEFNCNRCGGVFHYTALGNWYYHFDGIDVGVASRPIWCHNCKTLSNGEYIPTIEECHAAVLKESDNANAGDFQLRDRYVVFAKNRLKWRTLRQLQPRCLKCGEADFEWLPIESENAPAAFSHSGCGGIVLKSGWGIGSGPPLLFTIDGDRIASQEDEPSDPPKPPVSRDFK
jgi:hypothetical protein